MTGRGVLAGALLVIASLIPRQTIASVSAVSSLPLTTSGVHLGMEFNYREATVDGRKTDEGNVDYVFGADGGSDNVPASPGGVFHDMYLSWSRDAAGKAAEPISWYRTYHPDWLLYKSDRTTVPVVWGDNYAPLDFTNPAVQQYIIQNWIDPALAGGFQGVSFDNSLAFNYLGAAGHYTSTGAWVHLYSGNWNDRTYANAQVAAFRRIVAAVRAGHPLATVGINQGVDCNNNLMLNEAGQQYADIVTDQQGFTNSANTSLPYTAQYANQFCPRGKWLTVAKWARHLGRDLGKGLFLINPEPYNVTPYQTNIDAHARFDLQWALANYLLVKYAHTYFWWGAWADQAGYPPVMQREETAAQAIGSPTDDFYACRGGPQCPTGVYMRDFSNGLAAVNPSLRKADTVHFPSHKYQDLYGNAITTATLPAHSGLVLLGIPGARGVGVPPAAASRRPAHRPSARYSRTPGRLRPPPTLSPPPHPTRSRPGLASTPERTRPRTGPTHPLPLRLAIENVQIWHRVRGRLVMTSVLSQGETATFVVTYRVHPPVAGTPDATLLIARGKTIVMRAPMTRHPGSGQKSFRVTISLRKNLYGRFWAHFVLHDRAVSVERLYSLTIAPLRQ